MRSCARIILPSLSHSRAVVSASVCQSAWRRSSVLRVSPSFGIPPDICVGLTHVYVLPYSWRDAQRRSAILRVSPHFGRPPDVCDSPSRVRFTPPFPPESAKSNPLSAQSVHHLFLPLSVWPASVCPIPSNPGFLCLPPSALSILRPCCLSDPKTGFPYPL